MRIAVVVGLVLGLAVTAAGCGSGGGGGSSSGSSGGGRLPGGGGTGGGFTIGGGPTITSVTPASAPPGATVTIAGAGFATTPGGEVVRFGGTAAGIASTSATAIVAVVPNVAAGSAPVTVAVGALGSPAAAFTVLVAPAGAPVLISLTPPSGPVSQSVTLNGSNLASVLAVRFAAQTISTTAGHFPAPNVPPGAYPVVALDGAGRASGTQTFTVVPQITSLATNPTLAGSTITITGSNFGTAAVDVSFGAFTTASGLPGATTVQVVVPNPFPAQLPQSVAVAVIANPRSAQPAASNTLSLTINAPPTGQPPSVSTINPSSGPAGTTVQLTGINFSTTPAVTVGGFAALVGNGPTSTDLSFAVPGNVALTAGANPVQVDVVVTNASGLSSAPVKFTVTAPVTPCRVISIDPPGGVKNQVVVLRGAGFGNAAPVVNFNGITNATVVSSTDASVTIQVPDLGSSSGPVGVTVKPQGSSVASQAASFRYSQKWSGGFVGSFVAGPSMSTPRASHTSTLLLDGTVLIVGGDAGNTNAGLDTAELFTPSGPTSGTGTFLTLAGRMSVPRLGHSATLLPDGRVLIAGGFGDPGGGTQIYFSTEIYNPGTRTFSPGPPMNHVRDGHVAVPLANGDVLLAGGEGVFSAGQLPQPISSVERYLYQAGGVGSFAPSATIPSPASLNFARLQAGAVPTFGGAFVLGGFDSLSLPEFASGEIYDQVANTWTKGTQASGLFIMNIPRAAAGVVRLNNGNIGAIGGYSPSGRAALTGQDPETTLEVMSTDPTNPNAGKFLRAGFQFVARVGHTTTVRSDGTVLAAGSAELFGSDSSAIFSATLGAVLSSPHLQKARFDHAATMLFDGRVLLTGGGGNATVVPGINNGANVAVEASSELLNP